MPVLNITITDVSTGVNQVTTSQTAISNQELLNPIHYIVIVLMFYMGGLTVLMIKYIQSENKEARYQQYYVDFVKRPGFNRPRLMEEIRSPTQDAFNCDLPVTKLTEHASFYHKSSGSYGNKIEGRRSKPLFEGATTFSNINSNEILLREDNSSAGCQFVLLKDTFEEIKIELTAQQQDDNDGLLMKTFHQEPLHSDSEANSCL